MYNGEPIRNWAGTIPSFLNSGTNGIALANGNVYWAIKASYRYYFAPQSAFVSGLTDEEIMEQIEVPGNYPSESTGMSADDRGRIYVGASAVSLIPVSQSGPN